MRALGFSRTVLVGELARAPQLHYAQAGQLRALLSLRTDVPPPSPALASTSDGVHWVYCEGRLAEQAAAVPSGALVYVEGQNRDQLMIDPAGHRHRIAFVSATTVRRLCHAPLQEGANLVTLLGQLTRQGEGGGFVCPHEPATFRVMTVHRTGDERKADYAAEYHSVRLEGVLARRIARSCPEPALALIEGRMRSQRWLDGQGVSHRMITILAHHFQLIVSGADNGLPEFNAELRAGYDVKLPEEELRHTA